MTEDELMNEHDQTEDERLEAEKRPLKGLLVELPELARALARTYENRRPPVRRGRLHTV